MTPGHPEIAPGIYGTGVSWGAGIVAFSSAAMPVLQAFALLISIVAGLLTAVWTYKKIRAENLRANALVAAEALKATAVVTATALEEKK